MNALKQIFGIIIASLAITPLTRTAPDLKDFTLDEKIGQFFVVAAVADEESNAELMKKKPYRMDKEYIAHLIKTQHVGGIIFLGRGTQAQVRERMAYFQSISKRPLLGCIDAEWGLEMRLIDGMRFPRAMTLGAVNDPALVEKMAYYIGSECKEIGIHCNFAPVADVNNNSANPVINDRSFGDNPAAVACNAAAYARGLQKAGVIACAKHFPGHGDTNVDSHYDLPTISHNRARLEEVELAPYKTLIPEKIAAIMTAHLQVPALETQPHTPASLSRAIVTDLLRTKMGFAGLIVTDGLDMAGVTKHAPQPGEVELKALLAGNDILLCPTHVAPAIALIKEALAQGTLSPQELDDHLQRIMQAKEWAFAQKKSENYDAKHALELKKELYSKAITVLSKSNVPHAPSTSFIHIGADTQTLFAKRTQQYSPNSAHWYLPAQAPAEQVKDIYEYAKKHHHITIVLHKMNKFKQQNFGLSHETIALIQNLKKDGKDITLVIFGSPYSVCNFNDIEQICIAYEDTPEAQEAAADACRNFKADGKLSVKI